MKVYTIRVDIDVSSQPLIRCHAQEFSACKKMLNLLPSLFWNDNHRLVWVLYYARTPFILPFVLLFASFILILNVSICRFCTTISLHLARIHWTYSCVLWISVYVCTVHIYTLKLEKLCMGDIKNTCQKRRQSKLACPSPSWLQHDMPNTGDVLCYGAAGHLLLDVVKNKYQRSLTKYGLLNVCINERRLGKWKKFFFVGIYTLGTICCLCHMM